MSINSDAADERTPLIPNGNFSGTANRTASEPEDKLIEDELLAPPTGSLSRTASIRQLFPSPVELEPKKPTRKIPTGIKNILFWGVGDIASVGAKRELRPSDLYYLEKQDTTANATNRLEKRWNAQKGSKSITSAVLKTWWVGLTLIMLRLIAVALLQYLGVILVPYIIDWLKDKTLPFWWGICYTSSIIIALLIVRVLNTNGNAQAYRVSWQIQSALTMLVYKKTLIVAPQKNQTAGNLITVLGTDTQTLAWILPDILDSIVSIPRVMAAMVLLYIRIKYYAFVSIGLMIIMVPISGKLGQIIYRINSEQRKATDSRVKLVNELVQGIRLVKFYAWEDPLQKNITAARKTELKIIARMMRWQALMQFLLLASPLFILAGTFTAYGLTEDLDLTTAMSVVVVIAALRSDFANLPEIVSGLSQWKTSSTRIEELMARPELKPRFPGYKESKYPRIVSRGSTFRWDLHDEVVAGQEPFTLRNINIDIRRPTLVSIIGDVGCGKTSLLAALLGDMPVASGESHIAGEIAYVPQQAWIINATVRSNIVLGLPYDPVKFKKVVQVCCLEQDLASMSAGEFTEIGERGVTLSGGQRARISLARALYSDAHVYFLDDPLAAVDTRVGASVPALPPLVSSADPENCSELFNKAIKGYLKNKIVMFVTNQLQFVPQTDKVIYLDNGRVKAEGNFDEIMRGDESLRQMLLSQGIFPGAAEKSKKKSAAGAAGLGGGEDGEGENEDMKKKGKLIDAEHREKGYVAFGVYVYYAAAAGAALCFFMFFIRSLMTASNVTETWWLTFWSNDQPLNKRPSYFYVGIYSGLTMFEASMALLFLMLLTLFVYNSGRRLHKRILQGIIRAPTAFFDETPVGRALARFSFDFSVIDIQMSPVLLLFVLTGFQLIGTLVSMSLGAYMMLAVAIPTAIVAYFFQRYYRKSAIQIRRLLSVARAPVYSHFSETLAGAPSIRAYECEPEFVRRMTDKLDDQVVCMLGNRWLQSWFNLRLSTLAVFVQAAAYAVVVFMRVYDFGNVDLASVTISMTPNLTYGFVQVTSAMVQVEQNMNSVERVKEYATLDQEAPAVIPDKRPPTNWPAEGRIVFENYTVYYKSKEKPALRDLNFTIKAGERVGIVGRTGAGKSTLMLALFRMVEASSGTIRIDGVDISRIGLNDLRTQLSIIPQEPLLFVGTLRYNLDPFGLYSEQEYWEVLVTCQLKEFISALPAKLDTPVEENGRNFSVGQRQLICMARCLLRKSPICLLDEASASLSTSLDATIQQTIRKSFGRATVLIVAHRLNTIMDMDRVMVMEEGRLAEFDAPSNLLKNPNTMFSRMVDATGTQQAAHLRGLAGVESAATASREVRGQV